MAASAGRKEGETGRTVSLGEALTLTRHAEQAYRLHHPEAEMADIEAAISAGYPVDFALAAELCGRRRRDPDSAYIVAVDCRGMFVVRGGRSVITYLRFQLQQEQMTWGWFRPGEPWTDSRGPAGPTLVELRAQLVQNTAARKIVRAELTAAGQKLSAIHVEREKITTEISRRERLRLP